MEVSEDNMDLIEKIRNYRGCREVKEILELENEVLKKENDELKKVFIDLKAGIINQENLLNNIKDLKKEKKFLKESMERYKNKFNFLVTTPDCTHSVYAEIRNSLSNARTEVLVCSPWITYLVEEFKDFKGKVDLKVITNFRKEDVKMGITDLDKLRVLSDLGAKVRYNNDVHAKIIVIDSRVAIISSANLTKKGLRVNYEAGVKINDHDSVGMAKEFFNGVWENSLPLTEEMIKNFE
jgi:hypothetical protein